MPSVKQTSQQGNEYNRVEQGFTEWSRKTSAIDSYKQMERFKIYLLDLPEELSRS
jgi:hypothetical protein